MADKPKLRQLNPKLIAFLKREKLLTKFKKESAKQGRHLLSYSKTMIMDVCDGVNWRYTNEGYDYWKVLHNKFEQEY